MGNKLISMKKHIFILLFLLSSICAFSQNDSINFFLRNDYSVYLGSNGTRPLFDDDWKSSTNFLFGANSLINLNQSFNTVFGIQYSTRGGESYQLTRDKLRSRYIDTYLSLHYVANKNISFIAGMQYGYNFKTIKKNYNSFLREYSTEILNDVDYSQFETFLGINLSLFEKAYLNFKYILPNQNLQYSNYQFTVGYYFYKSKKNKKQYVFKEYRNPLAIEKLKLKETDLTEIPAQVFQMRNLKELVIIKSNIKHIPAEIANLEKLEKLVLQFNNIDSIAPEIGYLKKLKYLDLQYNHLDTLPKEIGELSSLEFLYLGNNILEELPKTLGDNTKLKFLYIGKNNLFGLPDELSQLENLIELDIFKSGTMLRIPDSYNRLRNLEYLYIDSNTQFPFSISNFNPRLKIVRKSNTKANLNY
jgi:Leucine rich repeat